MPRRRKDCPLCGKKNLCKLSNHLADIHQLSSEQRRVYLKSSCANEEDIMSRSKKPRMENFDEGVSASFDSDSGDIFHSDVEGEKEHSSEHSSEDEKSSSDEEKSSSDKEKSSSDEEEEKEYGCEEESEDGDHQTSEDGDDYDPWQALIHEAKLQLFDEFHENVERLENEGFSKIEAKRESFSALLPKLRKELQDVYLDRLQWMSEMKKDPVHEKIMETKKRFIEDDSFDPDEAMVAAVKKRKYLLQHMLADKQHFYESDDDDTDVHYPLKNNLCHH